MDNKIYTDNFEQILKEKSDEYRIYPSKRVWHSIYNDLHPGKRWPSVTMSIFLVLILVFLGYLNTADNSFTNKINPEVAIGYTKNQTQTNSQHKKSVINNSNPSGEPVFLTAFSPSYTNTQQLFSDNANNQTDKISETKIITNTTVTEINLQDQPLTIRDKKLQEMRKAPVELSDLSAQGDTYSKVRKNEKKLQEEKIAAAEFNIDEYDENTASPSATVLKNSIPQEMNKNNINNNSSQENNTKIADLQKEKNTLSEEEKKWMEDFALHNLPPSRKWKDRLSVQIYAVPNMSYRTLGSNIKSPSPTAFANSNVNSAVTHKPSLGLEAGIGLSYAFAKKLLFKTGLQLNYTSYNINASKSEHPILTYLEFNDIQTGNTYSSSRVSYLSNSNLQSTTVHNTTYQLSVPIGLAVKLGGNDKLEWYAGTSIQPSYIFDGKAHLISEDLKNYVSDKSALRKWNLNSSIEAYVTYKTGGLNLQIGPQLRYQLQSTYKKEFTSKEKLYNVGIKLGMTKNF